MHRGATKTSTYDQYNFHLLGESKNAANEKKIQKWLAFLLKKDPEGEAVQTTLAQQRQRKGRSAAAGRLSTEQAAFYTRIALLEK